MGAPHPYDARFSAWVERILAAAPDLVGRWQPRSHVGSEFLLPAQASLSFSVLLQLQPDALCLGVGERVWFERFPLRAEETWRDLADDVQGLLSGRYRVVEQLRNGTCVRGDLEVPAGAAWRRTARWSRLHWPGGERRVRILQRVPADASHRDAEV